MIDWTNIVLIIIIIVNIVLSIIILSNQLSSDMNVKLFKNAFNDTIIQNVLKSMALSKNGYFLEIRREASSEKNMFKSGNKYVANCPNYDPDNGTWTVPLTSMYNFQVDYVSKELKHPETMTFVLETVDKSVSHTLNINTNQEEFQPFYLSCQHVLTKGEKYTFTTNVASLEDQVYPIRVVIFQRF
jgi:hypothetical protein